MNQHNILNAFSESGDRGPGPRDRNSDENRGHEGSFRNRGGREGQSRGKLFLVNSFWKKLKFDSKLM